MEILNFNFYGEKQIRNHAHAGVVGSGNLEVLLEPSGSGMAEVTVTTSLDGNEEIWRCVLERFFQENPVSARFEINDFGATPGVVQLRLMQVLELAEEADESEEKGEKKHESK